MAFVRYKATNRRSATGKQHLEAELGRGAGAPVVTRHRTSAEMVEPKPGERGFIPRGTDRRGTA